MFFDLAPSICNTILGTTLLEQSLPFFEIVAFCIRAIVHYMIHLLNKKIELFLV